MLAGLFRASKHYGRRMAVRDVTLNVGAAEIVGLVGPNGAGKTTLLRVLAGLVRLSSGVVRISDASRVAYFGGEHTIPGEVSARRWSSFWRARDLSQVTRRRFGVLSRGTRQRLGLEATLSAAGGGLLLLDEPWEGLDPDAARWLSDALIAQRALGTGVLVSSHRIHDLAAVCDRCEFLIDGVVSESGVVCSATAEPGERADLLLHAFDAARGKQ
jgi:ABC-2 type transport system ATP-binding protein